MEEGYNYFQELAYMVRKALEDASRQGLTHPDDNIEYELDSCLYQCSRKEMNQCLKFYLNELKEDLITYKFDLIVADMCVTKEEKKRRLAIKKDN